MDINQFLELTKTYDANQIAFALLAVVALIAILNTESGCSLTIGLILVAFILYLFLYPNSVLYTPSIF